MKNGLRSTSVTLALAGLAAATPAALAQSVSIDIAQPTLAPGDSTLITISASYPSGDYAMAGIGLDLVVNEIQGGLSDLQLVAPMDGPGTSVGTLGAGGIDGIIAGQLNFPPASIFADPTNPIAFYQLSYTFTAPISGSTLLDIETRTTRFDVYVDRDSGRSESRLGDVVEGRAMIVIPAPAGAVVLGLGALGFGRRRRA